MNRLKSILQCNGLYLILTIIILIYAFANVYLIKRESIYDISATTVVGTISNISINNNGVSLRIKSKEDIIAFYDGPEKFILGDKVEVNGVLNIPSENSVFNIFSYKQYLYNENIFYIMDVESIELISHTKNIFIKIKSKIVESMENRRTKAYLYAFILGDTSYIDNDVMKSYQINGVSHLFSISGEQVALMTLLLDKILKKNKMFVYFFVLFYMFITNFSPSIIRAGIFYILLSLNKKYKTNIKTINVLLLTLFVSLLFNPFLITKIGFQYSFTISFFLVLSGNLLSNKPKIISLIFVSIIAFLSSIPISINNFFQLNFLSVLYNLFFVPFVSSIVFPLSLISYIIQPFDKVLIILIEILEKVSLYLSNIDFAVITFGKICIVLLILYYMLLYFIIKNYKTKRNYIFLLMLLLVFYNKSYFNNKTEITFIDVGQGDSIFIKLPRNKGSILVDTGGNSSETFSLGKDVIVKYIKSCGIRKLDYLILTHGDYDHVGEALEIFEDINVKEVIINAGDINSNEYKIISNANKYSIKKEGDIINLNGYKFYFLNPITIRSENDNSLVIYTKIRNIDILLTGDIGKKVEENITNKYNLDIDILKIAHHGSSTSTSNIFIESIKPEYAVISVGVKNKYNHPDINTVEYLKNNVNKLYLTSENGSVKFSIGKSLIIYTSK